MAIGSMEKIYDNIRLMLYLTRHRQFPQAPPPAPPPSPIDLVSDDGCCDDDDDSDVMIIEPKEPGDAVAEVARGAPIASGKATADPVAEDEVILNSLQ